MTDFEVHPISTGKRLKELEANQPERTGDGVGSSIPVRLSYDDAEAFDMAEDNPEGYVETQFVHYRWGDILLRVSELNEPNCYDEAFFDGACEKLVRALSTHAPTQPTPPETGGQGDLVAELEELGHVREDGQRLWSYDDAQAFVDRFDCILAALKGGQQ